MATIEKMNVLKNIFKRSVAFISILAFVFLPVGEIAKPYLPEKFAEKIEKTAPEIREAKATDINDNLILFYNPASASSDLGTGMPSGAGNLGSDWGCISCSGDAYDNKFLVGSSSFGTGGAATHSGHTATVANNASTVTGDGDSSGTAYSHATHTHTSLSASFGAASNYPLYARLMMIKYVGTLPLTQLPDNVIAVFDVSSYGNLPTGWSPMTALENRIIIASDSADPANGGSDTSAHTITWSSLSQASETRKEGSSTANQTSASTHTHTAPSPSSSEAGSNVPVHASLVFATANGTVTDLSGVIAMFDATPQDETWSVISGAGGVLENDFIEASTSYNASAGGSNTHAHPNSTSGTSGLPSATTNGQGTGTDNTTAHATHRHTLTASSISTLSNKPPYKGIIFAKGRATTTQTHFRWYTDGALNSSDTLFYNPTGNGFATNFTIATGCSPGSEWDCIDDGSADTSTTAPTSDTETSELTSANAKSYLALANDALPAGATVTQLEVTFAGVDDEGQPNTTLTLGYCTTCDGLNDFMGTGQEINAADMTYTETFSSLNLSTADMNNLELVVLANGVRANISTLYAKVTYTTSLNSISAEDTAASGSEDLTVGTNYQLRFQVANNTVSVVNDSKWRLETARRGASCTSLSDGWSWSTVPLDPAVASDAFDIELTDNFADGASTSAAVLTAGASTFVNGYGLDNRTTTGFQNLNADEYTEFVYSIKPNSNANPNADYCFRMKRLADGTTPVTSNYSVYAYAGVQSVATPTFTQNNYQWRYNTDSIDPGAAIASENNSANIVNTQKVRLRVSLTVGTANLSAGAKAFKLKYSESLSGPWVDVGATTSFKEWRFYENPSVVHGTAVSTTLLLTDSNIRGVYHASNSIPANPFSADADQNIEYDFSLDPSRTNPNRTYYLRVFQADNSSVAGFNNHPTINIIPSVNSAAGGGGGPAGPGGNSGQGQAKGGGNSGGGDDGSGSDGDSGGGTPTDGGGSDGGGEASPVLFNWWSWLTQAIYSR